MLRRSRAECIGAVEDRLKLSAAGARGLVERVEGYNRAALAHNLALPRGIAPRPILRAERLIEQALSSEDEP